MAPASPASGTAASPKKAEASSPSSPKVSQQRLGTVSTDQVSHVLGLRYDQVTAVTQHYYQGDIMAPTTKSQIIRAQKFSVLYYYFMNLLFFVYALIMPAYTTSPMFGGLNIADMKFGLHHIIIYSILVAIPAVRFFFMSWDTEFYQFAVLLGGVELVFIICTAKEWSPGMPVLACIFVSNLLNMSISQVYWKKQFVKVVHNIKDLVPPEPYKVKDHTNYEVFSDGASFYTEFRRLWGLEKPRSQASYFDDRCGVFTTKHTVSHVEAMTHAYTQAVEPSANIATWKRDANELCSLSPLGLLDGMLNVFITNGVHAMTGLFLGQVLFANWGRNGILAPIAAVTMAFLSVGSVRRIKTWLQDSVGIAVAEKEWLAHEIAKMSAQREELWTEVIDVSTSFVGAEARLRATDADDQSGRLNIVFMWLVMASIADFIGESYLSRMYWNVSVEVRNMMEEMTPFDFRLFYHAKWEATWHGTLLKCFQNLMFVGISCVFFGSFYKGSLPPRLVIALIGASTFVQSVAKMVEAVQYAFNILGKGDTNRHKWVAEWVVGVCLLVLMTNILIWAYLVPIMRHDIWDLAGGCGAKLNQWFFPAACS